MIERACANPTGRLVKLVDNTWNLVCSVRLAETQPELADGLRRRKYGPARTKLLEAVGWDESDPNLQQMEQCCLRWSEN